jgi:lipopolysaccharide export system permease protein
MRRRLIPDFPGFRTLDRYILGKFMRTYIFGLVAMIIIIIVFDYSEKVDDFMEKGAPIKGIIYDYYLNFIPYIINQFSALFTFISVIFFTSKMATQTEIVAILAGGVSFRRLMWPYMVGSTLIAGVSLVLSLWVIPRSQEHSNQFLAKYMKKDPQQSYDPVVVSEVEDGLYIIIQGYNPDNETTPGLYMEKYSKDKELISKIEAKNVKFNSATGRWTSDRSKSMTLTGENEYQIERRHLDSLLSIDERELGQVKKLVKTMTIEELNDFRKDQVRKGSRNVSIIDVERHSRVSYPISTFILTIIGVALSSRKIRGGMGMHLGLGIVLCFSYIMLGRVFEQIAISGSIDPWIGVWLPNIIFAVIAVVVYFKAPK